MITSLEFAFLATSMLSAASPSSAVSQSAIENYTPSFVSCPSNFTLVRNASTGLSANESSYISTRQSSVLPDAWRTYLSNVQATSNNSLPDYVSSILNGSASSHPTLGIATSGGGYRAAIFGAGVLNAFDGRNASSASTGTGGLLQSASYLSGLSGGSWLVGSLIQANFPTFNDLIFGPDGNVYAPNSSDTGNSQFGSWLTYRNLLDPGSFDAIEDGDYLVDLIEEGRGKREAGFPVTLADAWGRDLARHFVNGTSARDFFSENSPHGAGVLFSGLTDLSSFVSYGIPFPIIVADSQSTNGNNSNVEWDSGDYQPLSNPVYEFNVYEMGSYDPILSAFTPTKYLGTSNESVCVTGFDQVSFIEGTSAELFNTVNITIEQALNSTIGKLLDELDIKFTQTGTELDVAYYPNPFKGVQSGVFIDSAQDYLTLVDGGENGENLPLQPLLAKARGVDTIVAIDGSADVNNFAAGLALIATQNRTDNFFPDAYSFPSVPNDTSIYISQNISRYPTFFGCNDSSPVPLIIYVANGAAPAGQPNITNTDTLQLEYDDDEVQEMLNQIDTIATQGRPEEGETVDPDWPACLACAVVERTRQGVGVERSGVCESCFERYCWSGES